jgi:iron-sulfur cluster repair protein YtfE (RIC family)
MKRTQVFREQHADLLAVATKLKPLLDVSKLKQDASQARAMLNSLAGKLNVHLAMEDKSLYPDLLAGNDPTIKAKAKKFVTEMGGIKETFKSYMGRYPSPEAIAKAPAEFIKETSEILGVLAKRISAEDTDLYVAVDNLK